MQKKHGRKMLRPMLSLLLVAVILSTAVGCGKAAEESPDVAETEIGIETNGDVSVVGEGSAKFMLTVVDQDGNETQFEVHTDQETVGAALTELELIDGDEGESGLYVKTVNGIRADYEEDGVYWAFYVNDEYAQTGVDATPITEGESYSFKVEKG